MGNWEELVDLYADYLNSGKWTSEGDGIIRCFG